MGFFGRRNEVADKLIRGIHQEHNFRVFACDTTQLSEKARELHDMWPTATAALSRTMSVGVIMGAMLKDESAHMNIEINGGGPIGKIFVDARANGTIRGYVGDPHVHYTYNETGKLAVGVAVGKEGYLNVIRGMEKKADFTGSVPLVSGEIGEDFAYYFTASEQIPSAVSVGCLVSEENKAIAAGGLVIQMLPDASDEDIRFVEEALKNLDPISDMIHRGMGVEDIVHRLADGVEILEEKNLFFDCGCSKDRMANALYTLTNKDRAEMIDESNGCEIVCHFCNTKYEFTGNELQAMNDDVANRWNQLNGKQ